MPRFNRLVARLLSGSADRSIRFTDLCRLLQAFGFEERIRGDHHIYTRTDISEIINLQPGQEGLAKPYQVRQVRNLILKNKLVTEGEA
jgi:predicted RNA binding protein YcfA (HicA-like mRNA interferase family)